MSGRGLGRHGVPAIGALLLVALAWPTVRGVLEASMERHMLLQYPMLMLSGALLAQALPRELARRLAAWNALGLTGLVATMLSLTVLMIPRVLDLALTDGSVEAVKFAALLATGAALRASWRRAGAVVQAFFMGGFVPMTVAVGVLYQDAPLRLCNAYRLDEQQALGTHLVGLAVALGSLWLVGTLRAVLASDRAAESRAGASPELPSATG